MTNTHASEAMASNSLRLPRLKIWQMSLLVAFAAIAVRNIQDQRMTEPALIALAAVGFIGYGLIGWLGWPATKEIERRLGKPARLSVYLVAMSLLFMLATAIYLVLEFRYRNG